MNEDESVTSHKKRGQKAWYKIFNQISKGNLSKLFYSQDRFSTYDDFKEAVGKK